MNCKFQRRLVAVFLITVTASISRYDLGDKVEENDKRTCLKKKIFPQTHSNKAGNGFENSKGASSRVFNNGYSKHFRDMTSGTKLKKMIKEHV